MTMGKPFGECLSELLKAFKLKGSTLAKGINVDSSLIYKWLRNERVPSYNSNYIILITNFFINNINNSFQKEIIFDLLKECHLMDLQTETICIEEAIGIYLKEAQGYSIELLAKKSNKKKQMHSLPKDMNSPGVDIVDIISGHNNVLHSALNILENIPKHPPGTEDTILITFNSDMEFFLCDKKFNIWWRKVLHNVLKKNWKIVCLVKLNKNVRRTIKIIEDMQLALSTGRYQLYYYKEISHSYMGNELIIVPEVSALYCFSSKLKNQVDSAFLFKSKKSIEILSGHFFQLFSSAKPLLNSYNWQKSAQFHHLFIETEEALGDKYIFNGDIGTTTIPNSLYEKYLNLSKKTTEEISEHLFHHKRRLDAFQSQVKYYKFKDIFFKESIETLVKEKKYSSTLYPLDNIVLHNGDIICHLENIIDMLQRFENYEIAIVKKRDYENISKICWMIKENNSVFINPHNCNAEDIDTYGNCKNSISLLIKEKDVVDAFCHYFLSMWNNITPVNKDKKEVIKWIHNKIDLLKNIK